MSVRRYLSRRATAHAAIPGMRCSSAVTEHREFLWVFCVRIGGVVARTRLSLVSSDCEELLLERGQSGVCRDVRGKKIESRILGPDSSDLGAFGEVCGALCVVQSVTKGDLR